MSNPTQVYANLKEKQPGVSYRSEAINEVHALASLNLDENPFFVRYFSAWFEEDYLYLMVITFASRGNANNPYNP